MNTIKRRLIAVVFVAVLSLTATTAISFAEVDHLDKIAKAPKPDRIENSKVNSSPKKSKQMKLNYIEDSEGYLCVYSPAAGEVYYQGEKMWFFFDVYDTWEEYYTSPWVAFLNQYNGIVDLFQCETADVDMWSYYDFDHKLTYAPGTYNVYMLNVPVDEYEEAIDGWDDWDNIPSVFIKVHIRKLKAPTSLKVAAGKKKVTISYKKATGASKYQIYRSTKKKGGYKKIATTKKTKYVDKKVKRGKKYYYKVRTVRNVNGTIYSSYTGAKRSKKVK